MYVETYDKDFDCYIKVGAEFPGYNGAPTDHPYGGRDYELFGKLADCGRGGSSPWIENQGIPADVSEQIKAHVDGYGDDGHSHSYWTLQDFIEAEKTGVFKDVKGVNDFKCFRSVMAGWKTYFAGYDPLEVRFVFFFDN
jgi:hypothetical protein